jgi:DNA polymerase-4
MNILEESTSLRYLFVDMNSYFASCEQQMNPELRGKPIAVVPVMTDSTCAIAASYEAKAFGIKTGTPIWEAKKKCPDLKLVQARHKIYVELHHKFTEAIETCIPIDETVSIDEVSCKLDKVQSIPENANALAYNIKHTLRERVGEYLKCSIGIASNKLLAKLASDMKKPDGLTMLHPNQMPQAILCLKPRDISGIGRNIDLRLQRAGIITMHDLWNADAQALKRVWGSIYGVRFHALLHGADIANPVKSPTRSMSHQHVLAPVERSKTKATEVMRQLTVRVGQRLRDEGLYASRLYIHAKLLPEGYYTDEVTFKETQDTAFLLSLMTKLWSGMPSHLKPLRIGITLCDLSTQQTHQPDLFDQSKPAGLMKALDSLNGRFGRGTVGFGTATPAMGSKIAFSRVPDLDEF